jgi:hypothetical protein
MPFNLGTLQLTKGHSVFPSLFELDGGIIWFNKRNPFFFFFLSARDAPSWSVEFEIEKKKKKIKSKVKERRNLRESELCKSVQVNMTRVL